ncbi:MAG: Na+ ATPase [Vezdaea aestivalis]|nr:MAG: Na+ ATPase [Vezdaea aestivalis]
MAAASSKSSRLQEYSKLPFLLSVDETAGELSTNVECGLSPATAKTLEGEYGQNKLAGQGGVKWYTVLMKQISNAMILVLVLAMALSYGITDFIEGGVITAVIVLNVCIGFFQEYRAEQKMDALRSLSSPSASVLRDGDFNTIPSPEVVPGDIVQLKTGDTVPADLRLYEAMNLECDESILTGETVPVAKESDHDFSDVNDPLTVGVGDRINCAYSSSIVTKGRGRGIVIYTGMFTEVGKIASSMQGKDRKANRSLSHKKHGPLQPVKGATLRVWDRFLAILGLTEGTPLQIKLSKLAYVLLLCALILAIIVFGVNRFNVTNEVAIYAISTGIAIIPESLIAVLTLTMVVGTAAMARRKVLIRQLSALEALGGVTHICSDKTGTLTQGKMVTRKAWIPGAGIYTVNDSDEAANPTRGRVNLRPAPRSEEAGQAQLEREKADRDQKRSVAALKFDVPDDKKQRDQEKLRAVKEIDADSIGYESDESLPETGPELRAFLESIALCNLATVRFDEAKSEWQTTGDPTEVALQVFAHRFDSGKKKLETEQGWKQLSEYPFDSSVKRMSAVYKDPTSKETLIFTKGAVERIIDLCTHFGVGKHRAEITEPAKQEILSQMSMLADQGLRVLAVARRTSDTEINEKTDTPRDEVEANLTLLGLAGLYDPPRLETKDAVKECTNAGIRVSMLTGDHPQTASAIAKEVGIIPRNLGTLAPDVAACIVKTATQFDGMTDEEIDAMPALPLVIARCAPETKTRMIKAINRRNGFAAMTGDGVNDAPSLKVANVGIAMGLNGSDVAKGASDIVLTDDNFASIVNAIEEGRRMFDNIQKFILHLLTSNVGEVILLICGLGFQDKSGFSVFPLSPLQILWINMLTSSFPAFGLGREKASSEVMTRKPHDTKKGVFTWQIIADMMVYGTLMGMCTLLTFVAIVYGAANGNESLGTDCNKRYDASCDVVFRARASVFAELTWLILISAWEFKSIRRSVFRLDPTQTEHNFPFFHDIYENKFLFWAVVIGALSVFPAVYIPGLSTSVFKHKAITWEWAPAIIAVFIFVAGIELWKLVKRSTGWFNDGESDRSTSRESGLSLRQGFFSFAKTLTRSSSMNKEVDTPMRSKEGVGLQRTEETV